MLNQTKQGIRRAFNKAADTYDDFCHIQKTIGVELIQRLSKIGSYYQHIIDLGCGSGVVTELLALQINYQQFHAIDFADQLLVKANKRLSHYSVDVIENDFDFIHDKKFNLAFSNMSLQWSCDLLHTLKIIYENLHSNGVLAFSIPLFGTFNELNSMSVNHFYQLEEIINLLYQSQFDLLFKRTDVIQTHYDSTKSALNTIKSIGANYLVDRPINSLHGKSFLLQTNIRSLTYHVGYFIARK